eukprot:12411020-Karenia_brevis.AAC.1
MHSRDKPSSILQVTDAIGKATGTLARLCDEVIFENEGRVPVQTQWKLSAYSTMKGVIDLHTPTLVLKVLATAALHTQTTIR